MDNTDRIEKTKEKLLKKFEEVEGLKEITEKIINLLDSEIYKKVYDASMKGHEGGLTTEEYAEDLLKMPQVRMASNILKNPPLYVASLTGVIISIHFISMMHVIMWIFYTFLQKDLNHEDVLKAHTIILERLMSSLDNFNNVKEYQAPDEEFYKKLKKIKWDKQAKKLFKRISDLKFEISFEMFGSSFSTSFGTGEDFALTFLAACNAVNNNRNKILEEDVIKAYKTYLKLLSTDITKLG